MSLYRTWRPQSFSGLVGQDAVVRTLSSALESGKLAHAYLFSGPRGSGKTSAAKILARCINCVNGPTPTPDNTCENCRAILAGTALDVLEIDAASNRGIDEIRALRDAVKFAPAAMRKKVYIIDEAHMLTKEGANAFLKTLEEPPDHAVFILATTEPEKLPVTILSRCQRYAFRRIAIPVMIGRMRAIAAAEHIAIDDAALTAIAYRADGGLRDALTMLEQAASFADGPITPVTIDRAFGATGRDYAGALVDQIIAREAGAMLSTIHDASDSGADMQVLVRSLIAEFRNMLVGRIDPAQLARDLAAEDAQTAAARGRKLTQTQILRALRLLTEALATARSSGHPRLELESALLRYVFAAEDATFDALSARISALEEGNALSPLMPAARIEPPRAPPQQSAAAPPEPAAQPAPEPAREPAREPEPMPAPASAPGGPLTIQKVRAAWQNIRTNIESEKQSLRVQLARAVPEALEGNALVIKLPSSFMAETLRDHAKLVEKAMAEVLGTPIKAIFKVEGAARGKGAAEAQAPASNDNPEELFTYLNERIK
ncbi:MAG: DNA polymerase III subunit gamma/tau [Candidatus Baltobacteraceae bacterium]